VKTGGREKMKEEMRKGGTTGRREGGRNTTHVKEAGKRGMKPGTMEHVAEL
jgi:hypothetical protein